ncbi:thiamine-phosphate kinase [Bisgaard Taxon 10/6]|uniref:thiamine-phosphate kinase n=1 Tax=Exercitatus varius TaxID=67857 RepID=UPI00294AF301|nr:thiamine-phosphate kinase [Exercitatus varius]MDG2953594.1 thiamine-phosphate kinase [Exercitatus varius]
MPSEFNLIRQFFEQPQSVRRADVALSIGDDCAMLTVPAGKTLVVTTDTMVENSHFYPNIAPYDLGYKAVATNLSDLAAMGAEPAWVSLALTLPRTDETWLSEFSRGIFELLNAHQVQLIGGDTTQGEVLSVTITAHGFVEKSTALCRHQAREGDEIYVSGTLGDGLAGFHLLSDLFYERKSAVDFYEEFLIRRNLHPTPRIQLGQALARRRISRCALDLSDGLVGDLGHILERSRLSAILDLDALPCSDALIRLYGREQAERLALQGGEDYELCFTLSPDKKPLLEQYVQEFDVPVTCIGRIVAANEEKPIRFRRQGQNIQLQISSFEHLF